MPLIHGLNQTTLLMLFYFVVFYKCDECERCYTTEKQLKIHQLLHDPSRKFKCKYCTCRFAQQRYCNDHERKYHNKNLDVSNKGKFVM